MYLEVETNLCFLVMDFRLRHHINFSFYNYQLDEYQFIFDYCHRNYRLLFEIPRKSFYRNHSYCFLTLLDHLPMLNLFEILKAFEQPLNQYLVNSYPRFYFILEVNLYDLRKFNRLVSFL